MTRRTFRLVLMLLLVGQNAWAEPTNIRVSWTDSDAARSMAVSWTNTSLDAPNIVQYGYVAPGQFEAEAEAAQGPGDLGVVFSATLPDLKPDTEYQYRIGEPGNWTQTYTFRTAPEDPCKPFRFAALGDNRPDADFLPQLKWNPILEETVGAKPSFMVHTGDIVKDGQDVKQWRDFLNNSDPVLTGIPMLFAIGNHDDGPAEGNQANYNRIFALPTNDVTGTEDFYYVRYGNAIVVSLSSQTFTGGDVPFATQADWLDQVLTDNPAKWKFVFLHHPPYASHASFNYLFGEFEFNHPPDEKGFNATLVPIFDKHHVDIVFAGHNHYYERLGPLVYGTDPAQGTPVADPADGTIYIITGGAGALVYDEFEIPWVEIEIDLINWVCGKAKGSKSCAGDHHFVTIDIDDGHLHFEAKATAQQTVGWDEGNQALIDAFDIFKEDTPECLVEPPVDEPVYAEPMPDVIEEPSIVETVEAMPDLVSDLPPTYEVLEAGAMDAPGGEVGPAAEKAPETVGADVVEPLDLGHAHSGGCGCRTAAAPLPSGAAPLALLLLALYAALRRRGQSNR